MMSSLTEKLFSYPESFADFAPPMNSELEEGIQRSSMLKIPVHSATLP